MRVMRGLWWMASGQAVLKATSRVGVFARISSVVGVSAVLCLTINAQSVLKTLNLQVKFFHAGRVNLSLWAPERELYPCRRFTVEFIVPPPCLPVDFPRVRNANG